MAGIKETFSKGLTAINLKTNRFMEVTKLKTYISTLIEEKKTLKLQLADTLYEQWKNGALDQQALEPLLFQIRGKEEEIALQNQKIEELEREENQILGRQEQMNAGEAICFCPSCGARNKAGSRFCIRCGSPLGM